MNPETVQYYKVFIRAVWARSRWRCVMKPIDPYATCPCCGELLKTMREGLDELCRRCDAEVRALIQETKVRP